MISPTELANGFALNLRMVVNQTKDLTHADSIVQPPVPGNCLNWVLGHMAETRSRVLQLLGQPPIFTEAQAKRYGYGSEPVCSDASDVVKLETLLALLEQSQPAIEAGLARVTPEELAREIQSPRGSTSAANRLFILYRHETYHLGQTELLRELALASKRR